MYHVELRKFPHNFNQFNLSDGELQAIVALWLHEKPFELGGRRWAPYEARLTIVEGPQLDVGELSMGRGWRSAQRRGEDVTERVLEAARRAGGGERERADAAQEAGLAAAPQPSSQPGEAGASGHSRALADPLALGVQMAALLGSDAARLLDAWREASVREPALKPSETLAQAERDLGAGASVEH